MATCQLELVTLDPLKERAKPTVEIKHKWVKLASSGLNHDYPGVSDSGPALLPTTACSSCHLWLHDVGSATFIPPLGAWRLGGRCQLAGPESHLHTLDGKTNIWLLPSGESPKLKKEFRLWAAKTLTYSYLPCLLWASFSLDRHALFLYPTFMEEASRSFTNLSLIFAPRIESNSINGVWQAQGTMRLFLSISWPLASINVS